MSPTPGFRGVHPKSHGTRCGTRSREQGWAVRIPTAQRRIPSWPSWGASASQTGSGGPRRAESLAFCSPSRQPREVTLGLGRLGRRAHNAAKQTPAWQKCGFTPDPV